MLYAVENGAVCWYFHVCVCVVYTACTVSAVWPVWRSSSMSSEGQSDLDHVHCVILLRGWTMHCRVTSG